MRLIDADELIDELSDVKTEILKDIEIAKETEDGFMLISCENQLRVLNRALSRIDSQIKINTWIPCSERVPEQPKPNEEFDGKPLELYLVTVPYSKYPFRAFWNGKYFTDGFSKADVIAWMPLPELYKEE